MTNIDAEIDRLIRRAEPAAGDGRWTPELLRVRFHLSQVVGNDDVNFTEDQVIRYIRGVPDGELVRIRWIGVKGIAKLRQIAPCIPPE